MYKYFLMAMETRFDAIQFWLSLHVADEITKCTSLICWVKVLFLKWFLDKYKYSQWGRQLYILYILKYTLKFLNFIFCQPERWTLFQWTLSVVMIGKCNQNILNETHLVCSVQTSSGHSSALHFHSKFIFFEF